MAEAATNYTSPYTVQDVLQAGHLGPSKVLAGAGGLNRSVTTMTVVTSPDPRNWLRGGEFVLANGYTLKDMPGGLMSLLDLLVGCGCSALGLKLGRYIDRVPDDVLRRADELGFPLVQVPPELAWGEAIGDFVEQIRSRDAMVRMDLIDTCLEQYPTRPLRAIRALTEGMNRTFGATFAVLDKDNRVLASVPQMEYPPRPAGESAGDSETIRVEPVNGADGVLGYLVARASTSAGFPPRFDVLWGFAKLLVANQLTLLHFRQDLALSRARALNEFIGNQSATLSPQEFGLTPDDRIRVVAVGPLDRAPATEDLEDAISGPTVFVGDTLVGISRLTARDSVVSALSADLALVDAATLRYGVSQETPAERIGQAVREALSSLSVAKAMSEDGARVVFYEEIGLISLMLKQVTAEQLSAAYDDILGKLKTMGPSWAELLTTLEVYLATDGSAAECCRRLHIHPSTFKYRLQRIKAAIPLSTFEDKIRVYAALNMHRLSQNRAV